MLVLCNCHHAQMHTRTLPNLSKLVAIGLMPMYIVDCEGGLSALFVLKLMLSISFQVNSELLYGPEGPLIDEFTFD